VKVKIMHTEEYSDEFRKAYRAYFGRDGMATRDELLLHFIAYGRSIDSDIMWEYDRSQAVVDPKDLPF
jgi:hypothetical protein